MAYLSHDTIGEPLAEQVINILNVKRNGIHQSRFTLGRHVFATAFRIEDEQLSRNILQPIYVVAVGLAFATMTAETFVRRFLRDRKQRTSV